MNETLRIALVQLASTENWEANLATARRALTSLRNRCDLAILPENVLCLGRGSTVLSAARDFSELYATLGETCSECGVAAVFGGVPVRTSVPGKALNSSLVFDTDGHLLARYDKMHLFRLNADDGGSVDETQTYASGAEPAKLQVAGWTIGLSICYDLRFPELYREYAGADLMICTAAFTHRTGKAHWSVLLRARAIENLCYVAGVGQCGVNPETSIELYGNSLVAGPWGEVVERLDGHTAETRVVGLNAEAIQRARWALPALDHRRLHGPQADTEPPSP